MNPNLTICDPDRIERYLEQVLSDEEQWAFEQHLDHCTTCRDRLELAAADEEVWSGVRESLMSEPTLPDVLPSGNPVLDSTGEETSFSHSAILSLLSPTDDERSIGRLGTYEVRGVVGSGGMGIVLKAFDAALDRYVAIKLLAPHLGSSGAARKRFSREAQAAAAVVHDNVMEIYGVADGNGLPYLVMPYLRGPSLQRRLDDAGPLSLVEILRIAKQAASGLAAAHAQGLVHRDVKPANILLADGVERVKLTDFGLARAADDASLTKSGIIAGTPQFMSPEQARGESVDQRSDLFSLGSVLYAMCTGRAPFRAETSYGVLRRITDEEPRPIRELNPDIPDWLCEIIARLMSKRPEKRFESADDVAQMLEGCLAHVQQPTAVPLPEPLSKAESSPAVQRGRWTPLRWLAAAIGFLTLMLAGVVIVLETNKGTLTIESQADNVPIRIMQADKVVEKLTVTRSGTTSVRIAAGQYVVEIDGEMDGITVENGIVKLERGEREIVRIVEKNHASATNHSHSEHDHGHNSHSGQGGTTYEEFQAEVEARHGRNDSLATRLGWYRDWLPRLLQELDEANSSGRRRSIAADALGLANAVEEFSTSEKLLYELIKLSGSESEANRWRAELRGVYDRQRREMTAKVLEWIGLSLRPKSKDSFREKNVFAKFAGGMDVAFVRSHGPAEKAGIHEIDIVVKLQGQPVANRDEFDLAMQTAIQQIKQGDADVLQFVVLRNGGTFEVDVPFPARELDVQIPKLNTDSQLRVIKNGNAVADNQVIRGTEGYSGAKLPEASETPSHRGVISLDQLAAGTHWLLVRDNPPAVLRMELPASEKMIERILPQRPSLLGKNLDVKITVEIKDDVEFINIEIHNRTSELIRLTEADLDLMTAIDGPGADAHVLSPHWSKIAVGDVRSPGEVEDLPATTIAPGKSATLRVNWSDWVKHGFWFSRDGEVIAEPAFPELEVGKTWVRISPFSALPVSVTHPDMIITSLIRLHLAYLEPSPGLVDYAVEGSDQKIYAAQEPIATSIDIASAKVVDDSNGKPSVEITFTDECAKRMGQATEQHRDKPLAILVEGKLLSAPTIRTRITKKAQITGKFSREDAERIAKAINSRRKRVDH